MTTKVTFESTTALGLIDDIRAFLAMVDGDGADDAAEVATGTAGGASTRKKRETKAEKEARLAAEQAAAAQAAMAAPQPTFTPPGAQAQPGPTPTFGQQPAAAPAFGQAAPPAAAPELHPLAKAIIDVVDKSIAGGQPVENILGFFRPIIGPEAASATLDQIKQVFIPRMPEATLRQIAPQVGINV